MLENRLLLVPILLIIDKRITVTYIKALQLDGDGTNICTVVAANAFIFIIQQINIIIDHCGSHYNKKKTVVTHNISIVEQ